MDEVVRYKLNVSRRGPPPRPFGWEINQGDPPHEVARSPDTFRSRHEAIADGERIIETLRVATPSNAPMHTLER